MDTIVILVLAGGSMLGVVIIRACTRPSRVGVAPSEAEIAMRAWLCRVAVQVNWNGRLFDPRVYELLVDHDVVGIIPRRSRDPIASFITSRYPQWWFRGRDVTLSIEDTRGLWFFQKQPGIIVRYTHDGLPSVLKVIPREEANLGACFELGGLQVRR